MAKLSYVVPCYFNEGNLEPLFAVMKKTQPMFPPGTTFEYIFVDDGSKDGTWKMLQKLQTENNETFKLVKLLRNYGAHTAVFAGLRQAEGDCHTILSADLQDPPELIVEMFAEWQKGTMMVVAHRSDREDSFLTKLISNTFHILFKKFAIPDVPGGGFDSLLFDKKLTKEISNYTESGLHVHYSLFNLGYPFVAIPYVRRKREVGSSRWTFPKKVRLFIDAFVGYSYSPIRMISVLGFLFAFLCMVYMALVFVSYLLNGTKVEGWSSLMIVVLFIGAFQFISLGILGEYLWRVLDTVRTRPRFIVSQFIETHKKQ